MTLPTIWFLLLFVLLIGYAVLDGFDLGVGVLHWFVPRTDAERRLSINSIGPVWDGNEVWLLTGGGALFAAFPAVYAAIFSGFYLALVLLLVALIFRAVAMEFRSKVESPRWRRVWDSLFGIGSLLPGVLLGVAFGNVLRGLPLNADGDFTGSFLSLLNPFSVLVGVLTLVVFVMHGAIYLAMKTEGRMQARARKWIWPTWLLSVVIYIAVTVWATRLAPERFEGITDNPIFWVLGAALLAALIGVPYFACACKDALGKAIVCSGAVIACMIGLAATGLFPNLVPSTTGTINSLTIHNASSTTRTLTAMLVIALVGMPLVLIYTTVIYRAFKGKVTLTEESY